MGARPDLGSERKLRLPAVSRLMFNAKFELSDARGETVPGESCGFCPGLSDCADFPARRFQVRCGWRPFESCNPNLGMTEAVESVDDVRYEVLSRDALITGNPGIVARSPVPDC